MKNALKLLQGKQYANFIITYLPLSKVNCKFSRAINQVGVLSEYNNNVLFLQRWRHDFNFEGQSITHLKKKKFQKKEKKKY